MAMATLLARLNPTPAFPPHTGPYAVGTSDVEIAASTLTSAYANTLSPEGAVPTVAYRLFYPCTPPPAGQRERAATWISKPQSAVVAGYARFAGFNETLAHIASYLPQLLYYIKLGAHRDAELAKCPHPSGRWPVLLFSHGLGGSRNVYSHLCGSLASHGIVVVAVDHRDGSQPVAFVRRTDRSKAQTIEYQRTPFTPDEANYRAFDERLSTRIWELTAIFESLVALDTGKDVKNLNHVPSEDTFFNPLLAFHHRLNLSRGAVTFAGHSFGAATVVALLKTTFYPSSTVSRTLWSAPSSAAISRQITCATPSCLLDPWMFSLNSPHNSYLHSQPLPCYADASWASDPSAGKSGRRTAPLTIMSSAFFDWTKNLQSVKRLVADPHVRRSSSDAAVAYSPTTTTERSSTGDSVPKSSTTSSSSRPVPLIFYPTASAHHSQSDIGVLFPTLLKYFAKAEEPTRTVRLNVRAIIEYLRRSGGQVPTLPLLKDEGAAEEDFKDEDELEGGDGGFVVIEAGEDEADVRAKMLKAEEERYKGGDWRILSSVKGLVRGWNAVEVDAKKM